MGDKPSKINFSAIRLRSVLKLYGYGIREFGRMVENNEVCSSSTVVKALQTGTITITALDLIAKFLNCSTDYLLETGTKEPTTIDEIPPYRDSIADALKLYSDYKESLQFLLQYLNACHFRMTFTDGNGKRHYSKVTTEFYEEHLGEFNKAFRKTALEIINREED